MENIKILNLNRFALQTVMTVVYNDKTMADKLMCIPNDDTQITPYVEYKKWLKCLDTESNKPTNQIQ